MEQNTQAAKRFYKQATVAEIDNGFTIHLDGKPVRTPLGKKVLLPVLPLAEAVVEEWQTQADTIDPHAMPLSGFANTAIDRVGPERETVLDTLMKFAETDLLCYRADHPEDLVARQDEQWQPHLDWLADTFQAPLNVTAVVLPIAQPQETVQNLRGTLTGLDDMELTAVASLTVASGSLVLSLALERGRIDVEEIYTLSQLDDLFQNERWGLDAEAEARLRNIKNGMSSASRFLTFLRQ